MKFIPEKMIKDFGLSVYLKVSEVTGLKFKAQIKESGIELNEFYEMKDLISGEISYLILTNSDNIWFTDTKDFIQKFILHLKKSIKQLNSDYNELEKEKNQAVVDEYMIFLEDERIGHCGVKQLNLLKKMRGFRNEIPNIND